jgi:hypothetical protein
MIVDLQNKSVPFFTGTARRGSPGVVILPGAYPRRSRGADQHTVIETMFTAILPLAKRVCGLSSHSTEKDW